MDSLEHPDILLHNIQIYFSRN